MQVKNLTPNQTKHPIMLFIKKAIVEPPVPPTAFAATVTFVRDVASSAYSLIPPSAATAATDAKVASARVLERLYSHIPSRPASGARVAAHEYAREVASSIGSCLPDATRRVVELKSNVVAHVADNRIYLLSMLFALFAVLLVLAIPLWTDEDSTQVTKKAATEVEDECSTTTSSGSSLDGGASTQDGSDAPCYDDDDNDDNDYVVSSPSMTPSFEEFLKIAVHDVTSVSFPPKTPKGSWKKEGSTSTPTTTAASISGSSDNDDASSRSAASTPTRYSQLRKGLSSRSNLKKALSSSKKLSSPLRLSSRKLVFK